MGLSPSAASSGRLHLNITTWKTIRNAASALLLSGIATSFSPAQTTKIQVLNPPGAVYSTASGINNQGNIVGAFEMAGQELQGFAYLPATQKYRTFQYPGAEYTIALGINDSNTVVGTFANTDGQAHGFFLVNGKKFVQYDVSGSSGTAIHGINKAGDFAGTAGSEGFYQGFVSIGGVVTTFMASGRPTEAYGINGSNNAVGYFVNSQASGTHGFLRDGAGNITQIDYPGSISTLCSGINDAGTITGVYTDTRGVDHGFVRANGNYRTVGPAYIAAINNHGSIVGSFVTKSGETYGFLHLRGQ
jgi:probable HAF family extracellular repeat protein